MHLMATVSQFVCPECTFGGPTLYLMKAHKERESERERSRELEGQHTLDRLIYFQCSSGKMKAKKLRMTTGGNRREMEEEEEMSVTLPSVMQRVRGDNCLRSENVRVH